VATSLRKEPGFNVELINGDPGELSIAVNGRNVFRKGDSMARAEDVVAAVKQKVPAGAH
jgi:hypothetical protein